MHYIIRFLMQVILNKQVCKYILIICTLQTELRFQSTRVFLYCMTMYANEMRPSPSYCASTGAKWDCSRFKKHCSKYAAKCLRLSCHRWQLMFPWLPSILQDVPLHRFNQECSQKKNPKQKQTVRTCHRPFHWC